MMMNLLLVAIGGAIGSVGRFLTSQIALRLAGPGFPWGTFTVNIVGSFAIGIFAELVGRKFGASMPMRLFFITGILGGFTTFSAFSLETSMMIERGDFLTAAVYVSASIVLSVAALFAGLALVRGFV